MANLKINPQEYISATSSYNQMYFRGYNGYNVYSYSYSNGIHTLTGFGDYIQFTPTQAFSSSDTFVVNGTSVTAKTQDGEALSDGYFASESVVTCILNGTTLNFKSGGTALNFKVVGGVTQPSNPVENTIWVNTDVAVSGYSFSDWDYTGTSPAGWLHILCEKSSPVAFNAIKKNELFVFPISVKQYVGGTWVKKTAKTYQNGAWKDWITYYYTPGDPHENITGGWVATAGAWTEGADGISIASASNAVLMTANSVDLTNISTLKATADLSNAEGNPYLQFGIYSSGTIYEFAAQSTFAQANADGAIVTLDVSSFTGAYKLKFYGTRNAAFKILQVEGM